MRYSHLWFLALCWAVGELFCPATAIELRGRKLEQRIAMQEDSLEFIQWKNRLGLILNSSVPHRSASSPTSLFGKLGSDLSSLDTRAHGFYNNFRQSFRIFPLFWCAFLSLFGCICFACGKYNSVRAEAREASAEELLKQTPHERRESVHSRRSKRDSYLMSHQDTHLLLRASTEGERTNTLMMEPARKRSMSEDSEDLPKSKRCSPCLTCFDQSQARCFSALRRRWGTFLIDQVRKGIARYDMLGIGVKVKITGVTFNPITGRMELQNLVVCNPPGYHSDYILRAKQVILAVDMKKLIASKGNLIELHRVEFHKVKIVYEQGMFASNVDYVMKFIDGMEEQESGFLLQAGARVLNTVGGTLVRSGNFVSQEVRTVLEEVAPAPITNTYSFVARRAGDVLDSSKAIAGTTVAATAKVISAGAEGASSAATKTTDAVTFAAAASMDATRNAVNSMTRSRTMSVSPKGKEWGRRRSMSMADVKASHSSLEPEGTLDPEAGEQEQEEEEWLIVHRAIATEVTVRLASHAFGGAGMVLHIPDFDIPDVADSVPADSALDIARFLMKTLLATVHNKVSEQGEFVSKLIGKKEDLAEAPGINVDQFQQ